MKAARLFLLLLLASLGHSQTGPLRSYTSVSWVQQTDHGFLIRVLTHPQDRVQVTLTCPFEHCGQPEVDYNYSPNGPYTKFGELGPPVSSDDSHAYQVFITEGQKLGVMNIYIIVVGKFVLYHASIEVVEKSEDE
jgi:hypothetical protein